MDDMLELSRRIGINRNKLYYGFKQLTGKPISAFIQETRLEAAAPVRGRSAARTGSCSRVEKSRQVLAVLGRRGRV